MPPIVAEPGVILYVLPDGGKLLCNRVVNQCTNELIQETYNQICFPTTCSDVPGKIQPLCWSNRNDTYFPKVKRTYGTSGDKWPVNAKFIRKAN
jgi:hypothetical protein